jgi:hypothetical protein
MAIYVSAEARCSHCGKTAPCELKLYLVGGRGIGTRQYSAVNAAVSGIETWFRKDDGLACSEACRDILAADPRYANYDGRWTHCH